MPTASRTGLWGLLPGTVTVGGRLAALGPQQLRLGGMTLRGHSFHWSRLATSLAPYARAEPAPMAGRDTVMSEGEALYVRGLLRASYFHAWFASSPELVARLLSPEPLPMS